MVVAEFVNILPGWAEIRPLLHKRMFFCILIQFSGVKEIGLALFSTNTARTANLVFRCATLHHMVAWSVVLQPQDGQWTLQAVP